MTHLDLFSGIGGFALAAQWAGFQTIAFCEIEPYAQQVLIEKFGAVIADTPSGGLEEQGLRHPDLQPVQFHAGDRPILHPDIFTLNGTQYRGVTLVTGGFPCQPFSCAGKRRGKEDDRHLWPEMRRVIAEARPAFVLAENVPGIIGMELDNCLSDLEAIGYACGTLVVPACAVDARHRRDRVWILAHRDCRCERRVGESGREASAWHTASSQGQDVAESNLQGSQGRDGEELREGSCERIAGEGDSSMANPQRDDNWRANGTRRGKREQEQAEGDGMRENGYWLPEPDVGRVAHGIPNRAHRLRALGNAIVPQVAFQILKALP